MTIICATRLIFTLLSKDRLCLSRILLLRCSVDFSFVRTIGCGLILFLFLLTLIDLLLFFSSIIISCLLLGGFLLDLLQIVFVVLHALIAILKIF